MCGIIETKQIHQHEQDQVLDGGAIRHRCRVSHFRIRPDRRRIAQVVRALALKHLPRRPGGQQTLGLYLFIYLPVHHFLINGKDCVDRK